MYVTIALVLGKGVSGLPGQLQEASRTTFHTTGEIYDTQGCVVRGTQSDRVPTKSGQSGYWQFGLMQR